MRFLRRIFGLDFPDPQPGQVWRSRNSARAIRVLRVRPDDWGNVHVDVAHEYDLSPTGWTLIGMEYAASLAAWRRKLRDERRVLGSGAIEPPTPWPRHSAKQEAPR